MRLFCSLLSVLFGCLILLLPCGLTAQETPELLPQLQGVAAQSVQSLYKGDSAHLWKSMAPQMKSLLKSEDNVRSVSAELQKKFGKESSVIHEDLVRMPNGFFRYTRLARFSDSPRPVQLGLALTADGQLYALSFGPATQIEPGRFDSYADKTGLRLPLKDETWTVDQGGLLPSENAHCSTPDQRYAYDLILLKDNQFFSEKGTKNEDWFAFGQKVSAPAAGIVVVADDPAEDNPPLGPASSHASAQGNTIVIDHEDGEYSMFAHLRHGSFKVRVGQRVKAGEVVAEVGNSGDSRFSHLTYNLGTAPGWGQGDSLPIQFSKVLVKRIDGNDVSPVSTHMPVRGDLVEY